MSNLRRILYAEDNPKDVELTLTALQECNLVNEVDVVNDGQAVLDYLTFQGAYRMRAREYPGLVLLDIKMPRVDGIEVLRRIKADAKLRLIPVVMLTSSREERDLAESYKLGVNAYVVKPIEFSDFLHSVKQLGIFWAIVNEKPAVTAFGEE
jgi:CheY-like chemotaxis protein